jgi:transmembrane sensor
MKSYDPAILQAATEWYLRLTSGNTTDADYAAWTAWKNANAEHARIWKSIEEVTHSFAGLDTSLGMAVLDNGKRYAQPARTANGRRQALKQLGLLLVVGTTGWWTYRDKPWQELLADYATQTGETRNVVLEDGTRLMLNTDSLVSLNFSANERKVVLLRGEILIETGHGDKGLYRPFIVQTDHGAVTALGTRFSVRRHEAHTTVSLYEGSLSIAPKLGSRHSRVILQAGEFIEFDELAIIGRTTLSPGTDAWSTGFLIVDKMPLKEFLAELSRYRPGVLRCDPEVAALRISGAYPIYDPDAVLDSIAQTLPVRVETFTRYWTTIKAKIST